jgi:hypothetical protein
VAELDFPGTTSPNEAAVQSQRNQVDHAVSGGARAHIAEIRHEVGTDDVEIAENGGSVWKKLGYAPKLAPV